MEEKVKFCESYKGPILQHIIHIRTDAESNSFLYKHSFKILHHLLMLQLHFGHTKKKTTKQHQVFFMLRKLYDLDFSKCSSIGKKKKKKNLIIQKCYETFM